jgi:kumamolisin
VKQFARHYCKRRSAIHTHANSVSYTPVQLASIYNFPAKLTGSGYTIGIIELGGLFIQSDYNTYRSSLGLSSSSVTVVPVSGGTNGPSDPNGADDEVMGDVEVAGCAAPGAAIRLYFAPNTEAGFVAAIQQAVNDKCDAISISWGAPEDDWQDLTAMESVLQDAADAGISVFVAAGDNGSSDGESGNHVDYPGSSNYVVCVGGTSLQTNNGKRTSEVVWNDGTQGGATGGGISADWDLPSWQANAGTPSKNDRCVPDVASVADPNTGLALYVDGGSTVIGGTSMAAPLWAGLYAVLCQGAGKRIGFLNPLIYPIGEAGFYDVISGNNGTYVAKAGYDCCTGLGTPNGAALLAKLTSTVPQPPPSPPPTPPPPVTSTITLSVALQAGVYSVTLA